MVQNYPDERLWNLNPARSALTGRPRGLRALLGSLALGAVLALSGGLVTSCGGGGDGKGQGESEDDGASIEDLRDEVEEARKAAAEAGADKFFAKNFEKAISKFEEGEELVDEGKERDAKYKYRFALREFEKLAKNSVEVKEELEAAQEAAKEVGAKREEALAAKANETARREFERAEELYATVNAALESGEASKIRGAQAGFKRVIEAYDDAIRMSKEQAVVKLKAEGEKTAMAEVKKEAVEAGAEEYAKSDFLFAEQQERGADAELLAGNFDAAYRGYRSATQSYAAAITNAKVMKDLAQSSSSGGASVPAPTGAEPEFPELPAPPPPDIGGGELEPGGSVDRLPGDLDPKDMVIQEHIAKLAPSLAGGPSSYDPVSGQVMLDYSSGEVLRKDISPKFQLRPDYISWKDPFVPQTLPGEEEQEALALSFEANTKGQFIVPVPLTGKITIDYRVELMVMDSVGAMGPLLLSDDTTKTCWWVDFATLHRFVDRRTPAKVLPRIPERRRSANYWFDKKQPISMRVEVVPVEGEEGKSRIQVYYNMAAESEPSTVSPSFDSDASGFVGFRWSRVKFKIRSFQITGTLDKDKAIELLKEQGVQVEETTEEASAPRDPGSSDHVARSTPDREIRSGGIASRSPSGARLTNTEGSTSTGTSGESADDWDF